MDFLPAAMLEQHVLATLRVLGLYHALPLGQRHDALPRITALTTNLRALGAALEQRHGQTWDHVFRYGHEQLTLALVPERGRTPADLLLGTALDAILTLKHGPTDVRLAPPGLGQALVNLALVIEHLLVMLFHDRAPDAPDLTSSLFSRREAALLEVARQLAVLWSHDTLPPGHRATADGLRETAHEVREAMLHPGEDQGPGMSLVVPEPSWHANRWFTDEGSVAASTALDTLCTRLLRSLVTPMDSSLIRKHDGALALALDDLAASLVPAGQPGLGEPV